MALSRVHIVARNAMLVLLLNEAGGTFGRADVRRDGVDNNVNPR